MEDIIASGLVHLKIIQNVFVNHFNQSIDATKSFAMTMKSHPMIKKQLSTFLEYSQIYNEQWKKLLSTIPHLESTLNKPEITIAIGVFTLLLLVLIPVIIYRRKKSKVIAKTLTTASSYITPATTTTTTSSITTTSSTVSSSEKKISAIVATKPPEQTSKAVVPNTTTSTTVGKDTTSAAANGVVHDETSDNGINVGAFVRKLRVSGIKVKRIKNGLSSDQILRLTSKGIVAWSRSIFSKSQPISSLVSALEADSGFILEFKKCAPRFVVDKSETKYDTKSIIAHFNAITKKLLHEPSYITSICKANSSDIPDDDHDDNASVASELNPSRKNPTPAKTITAGNQLPAVSE